ncbi:hypothetical protein C5167_010279 [Papaver somniferum]|uniref:Uncharacterized protein n=1 Tax=Papaver somniferum TaxID=3469 RepID=A0A4Y7K3P2_PAPSO|nr:uncharacterized protein LOC113288808 [Papaver somniferum]RZC66595.1 hypothetical protein C5167_010279 [Papaver somniferum]
MELAKGCFGKGKLEKDKSGPSNPNKPMLAWPMNIFQKGKHASPSSTSNVSYPLKQRFPRLVLEGKGPIQQAEKRKKIIVKSYYSCGNRDGAHRLAAAAEVEEYADIQGFLMMY